MKLDLYFFFPNKNKLDPTLHMLHTKPQDILKIYVFQTWKSCYKYYEIFKNNIINYKLCFFFIFIVIGTITWIFRH